jgi:hypothetical protein
MKTLIFLILSIPLFAAESRIWTDTQGRTLTGTLKSKTPTEAEILLGNGKAVKLPLAKLSPDDRSYVEKTECGPVPEMKVKSSAFKNDPKSDHVSRTVTVSLSNITKPVTVKMLWITSSGVSPSKKKEATGDGDIAFENVWLTSNTYKGWAAVMIDGDGKELARQASMKPFEKHIDEAMAKKP